MKRCAALLLLAACESVADGAREHFSKAHTCPLARVEARARAELHVSDLKPRPAPSAEIAADPERLKMWQAKIDEDRARADSWDDIYEVRGCDHQMLLACHRYNKGQGGFICAGYDYPPNATRW